jgi:hypothetical protein
VFVRRRALAAEVAVRWGRICNARDACFLVRPKDDSFAFALSNQFCARARLAETLGWLPCARAKALGRVVALHGGRHWTSRPFLAQQSFLTAAQTRLCEEHRI